MFELIRAMIGIGALGLAALTWWVAGWPAGVVCLAAGWWVYQRGILWLVSRTDPIEPPNPQDFRIACVGDSITYGTFVEDRPQKCYPAVLKQLLGDGFSVGNFGVPGGTMSSRGDIPYIKYQAFPQLPKYLPQIVVLMLGTNDSKPQNWLGVDHFQSETRTLVDKILSLPSKPFLYLATPASAFVLPKHHKLMYNMQPEPLEQSRNAIRELATELGLPLIDIGASTAGFAQGFDFDGIHTNCSGAKWIAEAVHIAISPKVSELVGPRQSVTTQ